MVGRGYERSWYIAMIILFPLTIPSIQNVGNSYWKHNVHGKNQGQYFSSSVSVLVGLLLVDYYGTID